MSCIKTAKNTLRKTIKAKLALLEDNEKARQSLNVFNKLQQLDIYKSSKRVSIYLSTSNEIDTEPIIHHLLNNKRKCFVPRYEGDDMQMLSLHSMDDYNMLPLTKWNIKQPENDEGRENALDTGGVDLVIVPGVAFTSTGNRLGHGKGYYDTFLSSLRPKAKTVALAFKEQILEDIPIHDHDVVIDQVLYSD
uniref:5-formyltetrahydrofolate cyclo-ligase n=1 Tax=Xenopsylla cheopis TaxID=163159 RepID=A0A6M2DP64_XENCH